MMRIKDGRDDLNITMEFWHILVTAATMLEENPV